MVQMILAGELDREQYPKERCKPIRTTIDSYALQNPLRGNERKGFRRLLVNRETGGKSLKTRALSY